jgi:hypothetical protein
MPPGGVLAVAVADPLEGLPDDEELAPPLPDVREEDGWVYSSTPVNLREEPCATAIDRLRQAVSPDGDLDESMATIRLDRVEPGELEAQAQGAGGFAVRPRRHVPATTDYVGSAIVVLQAVR